MSLIAKFAAERSLSLLLCFFLGHSVFHFLGQSFAVLLPSIQESFLLSPVQIGTLITVRELVTGLISLPGGMVSDYFVNQRGRLLTVCLLVFALGWLIIASAPFSAILYLGMMCIAGASGVWHLPSLVELGSRFPDKRGTVFAIHGAGGSTGDIFGPIATGLLLAYFSWSNILTMYSALPLVLALWTYLLFRGMRGGRAEVVTEKKATVRAYSRENLKVSWEILKTTDIWLVNVVAGLRSMCFAVLITFLPLFMHDSGFSARSIGFHFGMLWAIGLLVSPLMGYLSDSFGRKIILIPTLLYSSLLTGFLAFYGNGIMFTIILILLGFSVRSDYSLINATIMDMVKGRVENTMLGVLSFSRCLMAAVAPVIAGTLYQYYGMQATLLFVSMLFLSAGIIFSFTKLETS
jgi:FSR family fosmidomycin resistance protein-like MFS transporter